MNISKVTLATICALVAFTGAAISQTRSEWDRLVALPAKPGEHYVWYAQKEVKELAPTCSVAGAKAVDDPERDKVVWLIECEGGARFAFFDDGGNRRWFRFNPMTGVLEKVP